MRAVTFQAPRVVSVEERPEPEPIDPEDAVVRIEASGVCGSDLHIYHGRVPVEPGFTIGHEYVGTVVAAGDAVTRVSVGDRVLGGFHTACGSCFFCRRGEYQRCLEGRTFGHGATLGSLQGTQAEMALVPRANLVLRRVPEGMSSDVALFAGDVMGTGFHAVEASGLRPGDVANVLGHLDRVLAMMSAGVLDPTPLVSRHMKLEEAPDAYATYDRREALKIVLTP